MLMILLIDDERLSWCSMCWLIDDDWLIDDVRLMIESIDEWVVDDTVIDDRYMSIDADDSADDVR